MIIHSQLCPIRPMGDAPIVAIRQIPLERRRAGLDLVPRARIRPGAATIFGYETPLEDR